MQVILETTNLVDLSFAEALLKDAGIDWFVADRHMCVMEGSIGIFPRRVMVEDDRAKEARILMEEAGLVSGKGLAAPEAGTA